MAGGLGRKEPTDWTHVEKYPLSAVPFAEAVKKPTPVVLGIPWYSRFDTPQADSSGRYYVAKASDNLGSIRGGHCLCAKPGGVTDYLSWWDFYNQGMTGECVGFGWSRCQTLMNRVRYKAEWLYMICTERDEWAGEHDPNSGTSVRAGGQVLIDDGHERLKWSAPQPSEGISTFRWATTVDEIHACLQSPLADRLGAIPLLNSWGRYFPHITWMPDEIMDRLFNEWGEAALPTDR